MLHGQKKEADRRTPEEKEKHAQAVAKKISEYNTLVSDILLKNKKDEFDHACFDSTLSVLRFNSEFYTAWNVRRRCLINILNDGLSTLAGLEDGLDQVEQQGGTDLSERVVDVEKEIFGLLARELEFTVECLKANPKSYWVWTHRRVALSWICNIFCFSVRLLLPPQVGKKEAPPAGPALPGQQKQARCRQKVDALLAAEFGLTEKLFRLDGRNFHCWNHRRWLVSLVQAMSPASFAATCTTMLQRHPAEYVHLQRHHHLPEDVEKELAFTRKLIDLDFSNYSAWHQRSKLLPAVYTERSAFLEAVLKEIDLVQNAFWTKPEDSSAWFYLRWLLAENPSAAPGQVESVNTLLAEGDLKEEEKKWPLFTLAILKAMLPEAQRDEAARRALLEQLQLQDPDRREHYTALLARMPC